MYYSLINSMSKGSVAFDSDAQAFITASAITNTTQKSAINTLVTDLKASNIWTKMKAIYPFVGGTASSHKWNLKDPRDLDAAFRLVFNGGMTHSATGILFGGTNGFADTKFVQTVNGLHNNQAISVYNRTNNTFNGVEMGARLGTQSDISLGAYGGSPIQGRINTYADTATVSNNILGFWQVTRVNTLLQTAYLKTLTGSNVITTPTAVINLPIYIGALNAPAVNPTVPNASYNTNREISFSSISDGLTNTEALNFEIAVQKYQTSLSRNV